MTQDSWNPLITGVVGSQAYGLARPDSDVDTLAVAAAPTAEFHGLTPPIGKKATRATNNPDITTHEVAKFVSLCLSANPTVNELLWLPPDCYRGIHPLGVELISLRQRLLSAHRVRDAYLGYAVAQFKRLKNRGTDFSSETTKRTEKHARHLLRLVHSGAELYLTGRLTVRVTEPSQYHYFGKIVATDKDRGLQLAESTLATHIAALDSKPSALRSEPDHEAAEQYLRTVRAHFYERTAA